MDEAQLQLLDCYTIATDLEAYSEAASKRQERLNLLHVRNQMRALAAIIMQLDTQPLTVFKNK